MIWHLALALEQLKAELNQRWPNRDHASDGAIGDTAHAATASDHNPNSEGVVCAYDIDTDLDGTDDSNDPEMDALVEWIRLHPHPNLKYVIYRGRMFSSYAAHGFAPFAWRPYTGDRHDTHPHVSVGQGRDGQSAPGTYDDTTSWLAGFDTPAPAPQPQEDIVTGTYVRRASSPAVHLYLETGGLKPVTSFGDCEEVHARTLGVKIVDYAASKDVKDGEGTVRKVWVLSEGAADMIGLPK